MLNLSWPTVIGIMVVIQTAGTFLDTYHISSKTKDYVRTLLTRYFVAIQELRFRDISRLVIKQMINSDGKFLSYKTAASFLISIFILILALSIFVSFGEMVVGEDIGGVSELLGPIIPFVFITIITLSIFRYAYNKFNIANTLRDKILIVVLGTVASPLLVMLIATAFFPILLRFYPDESFALLMEEIAGSVVSDMLDRNSHIASYDPIGAALIESMREAVAAKEITDSMRRQMVITSTFISSVLSTIFPLLLHLFLLVFIVFIRMFLLVVQKLALVVLDKASSPIMSPFSYFFALVNVIIGITKAVNSILKQTL
jgi:hypothetical protein